MALAANSYGVSLMMIRVPSIDIQKETVKKIVEIENKIDALKRQMAECISSKQAILDKYLK